MYTLDYRPFAFDVMIGQKAIISEMKKRSLTKEFPHVMIFEGVSGVGKTTLALIIAALLNDNNPLKKDNFLNPNPDSLSSKAIINERFNRDILLYDASTMGKDDVIALEAVVSSAPMFDENRIIIIDEAQELSKAGKGVTLKLLEKKRKNSYIILCTMNINSFDKAVKSRGQVYKFRSPSTSDIAEYLFTLITVLKLEVPEEFITKGIFTLAENCEGSVRLAVQNLERCVIAELFTEKDISDELGFISNEQLSNILLKILRKDSSVISEILDFSSSEFFYKASKTLVDSSIYLSTGYISQEWKTILAKKIAKYSYRELTEIFINVSKERYFREDIFLFELSKFMETFPKSKRTLVQ